MKSLYLLFVVTILLVNGNVIASEQIKRCVKQDKFTLMIHGGAGSGEKPELIQKKMLEVIKTVAAVKLVKNPIKAALRVMNNSRHVMFAGDGADNFAKKEQLDIVNNNYFYTSLKNTTKTYAKFNSINNIGTVGAVVMDRCGDWVAGTSTGGFKTKTSGRIGDSPIIGSGTYAENNICAVSCTGHGEYFIRYAVAHNICSLIKYKKSSGFDASKEVLVNELLPVNGKGGVIVIDNNGQGSFYFTTEGMSRGLVTEKGIYMGGIGWKYDEL